MSASKRDYVLKPLELGFQFGRYYTIFRRFRPYTMVAWNTYISNLYLAEMSLTNPALKDGCIIECGTWRGGMAAGLAVVCGPERNYYFFDSFRGLPPVTSEDGEKARLWQELKNDPRYFNNCTASLEEFKKVIALAEVPADHLHVYEGFFNETFPQVTVPPIAILRLDADWYESTLLCLEKFWDKLLPGALILIDDYFDWEGCRKAVHLFLSKAKACEPISHLCFGKVTYITKV